MSDLRKRLNAAYENGMFNEDWDDLDGVCALLLEAEARLAQLESVLAEAREAELTFTHEQISERDQVIADEAWNAALEAAISEAISEDTAAQIIDVMLSLRRGAS